MDRRDLVAPVRGVAAQLRWSEPGRNPPPKAPNPSFFTPPPGATPEQIAKFEERRAAFLNRKLDVNNIRIDNLEIGGPYER